MFISLLLLIKQVGKNLLRKTKDGRIFAWRVQNDDPLCTLQEAFEKVEHSIGFNIELKVRCSCGIYRGRTHTCSSSNHEDIPPKIWFLRYMLLKMLYILLCYGNSNIN